MLPRRRSQLFDAAWSLSSSACIFAATVQPVVLVYPFHTNFGFLQEYYAREFKAIVDIFTWQGLVDLLSSDAKAGNRVVFLLSSSGNYVCISLYAHVHFFLKT